MEWDLGFRSNRAVQEDLLYGLLLCGPLVAFHDFSFQFLLSEIGSSACERVYFPLGEIYANIQAKPEKWRNPKCPRMKLTRCKQDNQQR